MDPLKAPLTAAVMGLLKAGGFFFTSFMDSSSHDTNKMSHFCFSLNRLFFFPFLPLSVPLLLILLTSLSLHLVT